jgi:hypothetical protein
MMLVEDNLPNVPTLADLGADATPTALALGFLDLITAGEAKPPYKPGSPLWQRTWIPIMGEADELLFVQEPRPGETEELAMARAIAWCESVGVAYTIACKIWPGHPAVAAVAGIAAP